MKGACPDDCATKAPYFFIISKLFSLEVQKQGCWKLFRVKGTICYKKGIFLTKGQKKTKIYNIQRCERLEANPLSKNMLMDLKMSGNTIHRIMRLYHINLLWFTFSILFLSNLVVFCAPVAPLLCTRSAPIKLWKQKATPQRVQRHPASLSRKDLLLLIQCYYRKRPKLKLN